MTKDELRVYVPSEKGPSGERTPALLVRQGPVSHINRPSNQHTSPRLNRFCAPGYFNSQRKTFLLSTASSADQADGRVIAGQPSPPVIVSNPRLRAVLGKSNSASRYGQINDFPVNTLTDLIFYCERRLEPGYSPVQVGGDHRPKRGGVAKPINQ